VYLKGQKLVAKSARATTFDTRAQQNAKSYLEIEAYINSKLCPQTPLEEDAVHVQHLAPYLGEIVINQTMYLIWKASGEYTLEDYIEFDNGWVQLANDIGVEIQDGEEKIIHQRFARELLRQLLEGLAYCHSLGVIHRDIKVRIGHECVCFGIK
jgi:serine/threonine protein kinase